MGIHRPTPAFGIPNPSNTGLSMHNPQRMSTSPRSTSPRMPLPPWAAPWQPPISSRMPTGQIPKAIRPIVPTQSPEKPVKTPHPGDNETQTCKFCNDGVHYSKAPFIGMFSNKI